jgi:hypothetical protein
MRSRGECIAVSRMALTYLVIYRALEWTRVRSKGECIVISSMALTNLVIYRTLG